jgi:hypothetical protein
MTLEVDHGGGHGIPFGRPSPHRCLPHGPLVRQQLRPFGQASVTGWRDSEPANFIDQDERVALLTRCVSDTGLPADVRAVGALVLLYGAKITRISTLKTDDVHRTAKGSSTIALGCHPALLPPAMDRLVEQQAEAARRLQDSQPRPSSAPLAVPPAACPAATTQATTSPAAWSPTASTSAAILGVHINTAECWTHLAGRNWSTYLEARAQALQCE